MKRPLGMVIPLVCISVFSALPIGFVVFMVVTKDMLLQGNLFFILSLSGIFSMNIVGSLLMLFWQKGGVFLLGVSVLASVLIGFLVWDITIFGFALFYITLALPMLYFIALYPVMQNWQYFK